MTERLLQAAQVAAATAMLLRVGGYGEGWLPSLLLCMLLLLLLMSAGWMLRISAEGERREVIHRLRAWAEERWFWLGLISVVGFAMALRLYGIGDELGHIDMGIDQRRLARSVLDFFETGELNHTTVEHYPGIHFWFLAAGFSLAYLWGLMEGLAKTLSQMPLELFALMGQVVSALQGTATVLLTGLLGKRLVGPRVGLLAAGLMAISPLSLQLSAQVRNDAGQVMLITAAVVVALGVYRSGRGFEALVAGALAGLATGIKYSSLFVVLPVFLAAATSEEKERRGPSLALAVTGFVAALALSNHFLWADIPNFLTQLSDQIGITDETHWAAKGNPATFHISILARQVVGWPLMIVAAGLASLRLAAGRWRWWMFLSFPLIYIWFVAQRPSQFSRWVYPSAPFVAVAASAGLFVLVPFLVDRTFGADPRKKQLRMAAGLLLSFLLLSPMLWTWAHQTSRRFSPPTHSQVETWLEEQAAREDRVLIERGWLQLDRREVRLRRVRELLDSLDGGFYQLADHEWIVVHEWRLGHPALERLELVKRFKPDRSFGGNTGPDFAVYKPPPIEPLRLPASIDFDAPEAADFLGLDWPPDREEQPGLRLPAGGASLYLPPLEGDGVHLEILVRANRPSPGAPPNRGALPSLPIEVELGGEPLALERQVSEDGTVLMLAAELSNLRPAPGISRIMIRPADGNATTLVLGFRLR